MYLDRKELLEIAGLAHIAFTDAELEKTGERLCDAAEIFRDFDAFDVSAEQPEQSVCLSKNVLREDVPAVCPYMSSLFGGDAEKLSVPRVVGKEQ